MDDLPYVPPTQIADPPTREDLIELLTGLAPGWYRSRDLHPRYLVWAERKGRTPVTIKTLGETISRVMMLDKRRSKGNVVQFRVTPDAVAGRDWFVDPESITSPPVTRPAPPVDRPFVPVVRPAPPVARPAPAAEDLWASADEL
jgi:hypothetical protein